MAKAKAAAYYTTFVMVRSNFTHTQPVLRQFSRPVFAKKPEYPGNRVLYPV